MNNVAQPLEETPQPTKGETHAPEVEEVRRLEDVVRRYNDSPLGLWRSVARVGVVGGGVLLAALCLLVGLPKFAFGVFCLGVESALFAFVIAGLFSPTALFVKVREWVIGLGWQAWLTLVVGSMLCLVVMWLFGLLWVWVMVTLMAAVIGGTIYFALDRPVEDQRRRAIEDAEALFNELRLRGTAEETIRRFVCRFAGSDWEEFFEQQFGYAEKLKARDWWLRDQKGPPRPKHAAWREPIIDALNRRLLARRTEQEHRELQKLAAEQLLSGALLPTEAARPPQPEPAPVNSTTYNLAREEPGLRRPRPIEPVVPPEKRDVDRPKPPPPSLGRVLHNLLNAVLGPVQRMLLGVLLLTGCLAWMWQNGLIVQARDIQDLPHAQKILRAEGAGPLHISGIPADVTKWFNGYGAAVAGMLMLLSSFLPNWKAALLMPAAAALALFGPQLGVPAIDSLTAAQVSMTAGAGIGLLGIVLGRSP